jgi:hypothetical protein
MGKSLVAAGALLVLAGLAVLAAERWWPGLRLGRLPGDVVVERPGATVHLPLATSLVLSLVLTLALWLFSALRR